MLGRNVYQKLVSRPCVFAGFARNYGFDKEGASWLEVALADFPRFDLPDTEYDRLMHGVKLPVGEVPETPFTVYCRGELFGLGEKDEIGRLKIKTYLRD